jgi:hypothetical protein
MKSTKTKKCDWCCKRKLTNNVYILGEKDMTDKKIWIICSECNLKYDVV